MYPRVNQLVKALPQRLDSDGFEIVSSSEKGKGHASDQDTYADVRKWLSDWHLLVFLDGLGILDAADLKLTVAAATSKDPSAMDAFLRSHGWQTLVTIAAEQDGKPVQYVHNTGTERLRTCHTISYTCRPKRVYGGLGPSNRSTRVPV